MKKRWGNWRSAINTEELFEDLEAIQAMEDQLDIKEAKQNLSGSKSEFTPWESLIQSTELFTKDFMEEREQPEVQKRDLFE